MAGRGGRRPFPPRRAKTDLTGVLTTEEKNELSGLISDAIGKIEIRLEKSFETTYSGDIFEEPPWSLQPLPPPAQPDTAISAAINKENIPPGQLQKKSNVGASQSRPRSYSRAALPANPKPATTTHNNTSSARGSAENQHTELKKELLAMFKKWETSLLNRVKDITVREPEANGETSLRGGRGGLRGAGRGGRGNRGDRDSLRGISRPASTPPGGKGGARGGFGNQALARSGPTMTPPPNELDLALTRRFPPLSTWLSTLLPEKRKLLLHTTLLLVLSLECCSGFSRELMLYVTSSLCLSLSTLQEDEARLAQGLAQAADKVDLDAVLQQKTSENKKSRKWKAAGAALIGAAGSLAEPLAAAGIGSVVGGVRLSAPATAGLLGTVAHNGIVVGNMFGIYAGRETGKMIDQYGKDSADFALVALGGEQGEEEEEEYRDARAVLPTGRKMRVVLGVGGWLTQEDGSTVPFRCFGQRAEAFAVRYEVENLQALGTSLESIISSAAWQVAKKEMVKRTVTLSLKERQWPLGLLRVSKVIDNPWAIGMVRCEKAGMALAECIGRKIQGDRPVSLVGYSLGARAIYVCLMTLAERRQFGLVESVAMIGGPIPSDYRIWLAMRSAVTGRLINVYSESDYVLGFLCRTSNLEFGVAGLQPVSGLDNVENFNVSRTVTGHLRYQYMIGTILNIIGWEDLDLDQVSRDEELLAQKDKKYCKRKEQKTAHLPMERPVTGKKSGKENITKVESRMTKMKIQG